MNKSHQLPPGLQKAKVKHAKIIQIIESLLPPGTALEDLTAVDEVLAGRILVLENQITAMQANVDKSIPVFQRFNFSTPKTYFTLDHLVNQNAPVQLTYETLPQKIDIDYEIDGAVVRWINTEDTFVLGMVEVVYYRA